VWTSLALSGHVGSIPEGGGPIGIDGAFTESDTGDTFSLAINWGDGTPLQSVNLGTNKSFNGISHTYGPSVPTGIVLIDVTVINSNLETANRSTFFFIDNVPPALSNVTVTPAQVNQSNLVALTSNLLSGQEVPAQSTTTTATATATLNLSTNSLDINVFVSGLGGTDTITGAELHVGSAGSNGPALVTLDPARFVTDGAGMRLIQTDLTFPSANIPDLLAGNVYLNVDTTDFPQGEVRGQLYVQTTAAAPLLNGSQEVPPVSSTATGSAILAVNLAARTFDADVFVQGVSLANVTGADLRSGAAGSNGPAIATLDTSKFVTDGAGIRLFQTGLTLAPADLASLTAGNTYIDIHTIAFPTGEIRGQISMQNVTISGNITDPGTSDTFTAAVDFGDGSLPQIVPLPVGTTSFSVAHQYVDVVPAGVLSSTNSIQVTVTDKDGGVGSASMSATVHDVAPVLTNLAVTPVTEGGTAVVSGNIVDPGIHDTFTITANWGDGSSNDMFNFGAGTTSFNVSHRYATHGTFPANFTVTDNHTGSTSSGLVVMVASAAPINIFGLGLGSVNEFSTMTANSTPTAMTIGPDGNLWFTESSANKIGRITRSGTVTEFTVPTANSSLSAITTGSDGNLWFTEQSASKIGRITPSGAITEFPLTAGAGPAGIVSALDGNLWFTEQSANKIGRITPAGVVTEFTIPTANSLPDGITAGADGNLWFTEFGAGRIGKSDRQGNITDFAVPSGSASQPDGIATGGDGNLWFTEKAANRIGQLVLSPSGGVSFNEFVLPVGMSLPHAITLGGDSAMWFTEGGSNRLGRIDRSGAITEFLLPTPNSGPAGIATSIQGETWFTESNTSNIGVLTPRVAKNTSFTGSVAYFTDSNSTDTPSDFTATIAWGDGSSSSGTVLTYGTNFIVQGTHTYTAAGPYTVSVSLTKTGGTAIPATSSTHVAGPATPPSNLATVAIALTHSTEYFGNIVNFAYQHYLHRAPDIAGFNGWVGALFNHTIRDEQLEAGFIASPEYMNRFGSVPNWIQGIYQDLLGRSASQAEVNGWVQALNTLTPTQVALFFTGSREREANRVADDYRRFLGRVPALFEINEWTDAFANGTLTNEDVVAGFVGSFEYYNKHNSNINDWLTSAYFDLFGRHGDPTLDPGYNGWLAILQLGL
jgi:streptogramin lyase